MQRIDKIEKRYKMYTVFIFYSHFMFNLQAPCVLYIRTGVSLLSRERFLYI